MGNLRIGLCVMWWCCCGAGTPTIEEPGIQLGGWWFVNGADGDIVNDDGISTYPTVGKGPAATNQLSGYLLAESVAVPNAATIVSAEILLRNPTGLSAFCTTPATQPRSLYKNGSCKYGTNVRFDAYGEDIDDASEYTTVSAINAATRTTATTAVVLHTANNASGGGAAITAGVDALIADVTSIVQEIVNRVGWASGNNMQIFMDENGTDASDDANPAIGYSTIAYLQATTQRNPKLTISYT